MIDIEIKRPILIVGKPRTGKTTKALEILSDPIIEYANEFDIENNFSIPLDRGILIEEVDYKPNTEVIITTLLQYRGQIVLTSHNQKDVPKKIFDMCKLKRAGTTQYSLDARPGIVTHASPPINYDINVFGLIHDYLKTQDREDVLLKLKMNKPYDEQFLSWLALNIHPNKVAYLDAKVKRRWSQEYFYELLAYAHNGRITRKVEIPSRRFYSKIPNICRRIGLKRNEEYILDQLLEDEDFVKYVTKKVNNAERRALKLKEKTRKKVVKEKIKTLEEW